MGAHGGGLCAFPRRRRIGAWLGTHEGYPYVRTRGAAVSHRQNFSVDLRSTTAVADEACPN